MANSLSLCAAERLCWLRSVWTSAPTDLLFHGLESCGEYGRGQLGYVLAVFDSRFNPFLDQPLLQFDELRRAFHCGQRLHRSS